MTPLMEYFLARQPIFDRRLNLAGYELLYRRRDAGIAEIEDADLATSQVILNAYAENSFQSLAGSRTLFINLTRNFILRKLPLPFSPQQSVLEVPEYLQIDSAIIQGLCSLAREGYSIALDDVTSTSVLPLLDIASWIKVDLIALDKYEQLPDLVRFFKRYPARLLAEKVETHAQFEWCKELGFEYFQGFFLSKPDTTRGQYAPPNRLVILNMLARLNRPEVDFRDLEELVAQDAALGLKLLRLVNSATFGLPVRIQSVHQAMVLIGLKSLKGWLTLFLLTGTSDHPAELARTALLRARMAEELACSAGLRNPDSFFLAGLISVLDALLDIPMERVLDQVCLAPEILEGLLNGAGEIGASLQCVQAYEQANWDQVAFEALAPGQIRSIYLDTVRWADEIAFQVIENS